MICVAHAASEAARRGYMFYQNQLDLNGIPVPRDGTVDFLKPSFIEKKMCRACWQQLKTNNVGNRERVQAGALRSYERCALGNALSREYFQSGLDSSFWGVLLREFSDEISDSMVSKNWEWLFLHGLASDMGKSKEMGEVMEKMVVFFTQDNATECHINSSAVTYPKLDAGQLSIDMPHI
jgi:hypothetical protein